MSPDNNTFEAEQDALMSKEMADIITTSESNARGPVTPMATLRYRAKRKQKQKAAKATKRKQRR